MIVPILVGLLGIASVIFAAIRIKKKDTQYSNGSWIAVIAVGAACAIIGFALTPHYKGVSSIDALCGFLDEFLEILYEYFL